MLKNYIRIAWRNLQKHSFYTGLNIFCLSLGISCGLILFQFIHYHIGFDRYHRKAAQIYRVVTDLHLDDGSVKYEKGAPLALAAAIRAEIPQIKDQAFLFMNYRGHSFTVAAPQGGNAPDKLFAEHGTIAFADRHWFDLFDYGWEAGDARTALEAPNTAVLTRRQADKYFGNSDPIGKTIRLDDKEEVTITGLLDNPPANTDIKAEIFVSLSSLKGFYPDMHPSMETSWGWINSSNSLFLLLPDGLSPQVVDNALAGLKRKYMGEIAKYYDFHLQSLNEVHFDTRYDGVIPKSLLTTLGLIGFIILSIACVNFINVATAQNSRRAKEVSTRKVLGSTAAGIFWQFMIETACITLLAGVLSLGWVSLALPVLNQWLQTGLEFHLLRDKQMMAALFVLIAFIILGAGIYPAWHLSRYKPVEALKSRTGSVKQPWLRKSLILFQNLVAQSLIICTLIILLQTHYLKTADLGFNKEAVVMIPVPQADKNNLAYLQHQLLNQPGIKDASFCFRPPASDYFKAGSVKFDQREWEKYSALCTLGDSHYLSTFGLRLIAGRNLAESDTVREFLVSEDLVKKLGFTNPSQVLGHQLVAGALEDHPGTIVGVIRDFHLHSLHSALEPIMLTTSREAYAYAGIKISGAHPARSIAEIRRTWQSVYPHNIFDYHFLDEQIADFYKKEDLLNKLIGSFAVLAIVISCVGLFGLISLLTIQRTREIGIRKVIGASVSNIVVLLSKDFVQLVGLALIMASAIAWLTMSSWLQGFAYRITMPWWIFMLSGIGNLALSLLTISVHSIRAALMNPVTSLRSE
ncbi:MAG TPA: ABC transporter permease [Puia sp.]|nr:ABC transporter permease [Puia sp.]